MKNMHFKKILLLSTLLTTSLLKADQVFLDDTIVTGSQCIGLDCVNDEQFNFTSLLLKENNLRIKFQDTSSSASFPTNDWQITINDSTNGGDNFFSIENLDLTQTLFKISPNGKIAMGTDLDRFVLTSSGDLNILGTLSDSSDVNLKENITPVKNAQILKKISSLPVSTWNYKDNVNKDRHIGSMAQDFYKAFEYGPDNRHIAPKDAAFVAIVGVQELLNEITIRDKKIEKIENRLEKLEKVLNTLLKGAENTSSLNK